MRRLHDCDDAHSRQRSSSSHAESARARGDSKRVELSFPRLSQCSSARLGSTLSCCSLCGEMRRVARRRCSVLLCSAPLCSILSAASGGDGDDYSADNELGLSCTSRHFECAATYRPDEAKSARVVHSKWRLSHSLVEFGRCKRAAAQRALLASSSSLTRPSSP